MGNKIKLALISVTDKKGIVEFAKGLKGFGVEILSTGGTAAQIKAAGIDVTDVPAYTGLPEMMDGTAQDLHPKVHGGLLALRDHQEHMKVGRAHGHRDDRHGRHQSLPASEDAVAKPAARHRGGHREHRHRRPHHGSARRPKELPLVSIVTDPRTTRRSSRKMKKNRPEVSERPTSPLSTKAFQLTAATTRPSPTGWGTILPGRRQEDFPDVYTLQFQKAQDCATGRTPIKGRLLREGVPADSRHRPGPAAAGQGALPTTTFMDSDAAWQDGRGTSELPTAVIQ